MGGFKGEEGVQCPPKPFEKLSFESFLIREAVSKAIGDNLGQGRRNRRNFGQ